MATTNQDLLRQFDRGLRVQGSVILAPDGSSILLDRWLAHCPVPRARRALTPSDNAPDRFLSGLLTVVRPLLTRTPAIKLSGETHVLDAIVELLNALLAVEHDFALVLENYEAIATPDIHAAVRLIVDYPPPQMHLYLVSESVPPIPLARLRVRRQLIEIDMRS